MLFTYIFGAVLFASQASAAVTHNSVLVARQTTEELLAAIPPQCQSSCEDATAILQRCGSLTGDAAGECLCVPATISSLDTCFECLIDMASAGGDTVTDLVRDQADLVIDQLETTCRSAGRPIGGSDDDDDADDDDDTSAAPTGTGRNTITPSGSQTGDLPSASGGASNGDEQDSDNDPSDLLGAASPLSFSMAAVAATVAGAALLF
ncbi:hypothetical protein CC1G_07941 [Coprinopsis cinerea okayama7|uniref:Extracellular membrane protein CFEM domain-containing protein n=1 Tax=Coprinopsis cinerea (strain Okayama-7 / 130 / ATCC MYA-4618 / FGSC 9003) TaxID=240176 RepID=A8P1Y6_COPC7|nr:hypothetical protein CC1G_07941 [Coprinopsis cinerea okayama7\|eukprot:XP_001838200.1 hypothetical protein CC1G_07941 [Coprinopsis cinerea okayama7\